MIGWASVNFLAFFDTLLQNKCTCNNKNVWNRWVQFMRIPLLLGNFIQQKGVGISSKFSLIHPSAIFSYQKVPGKQFREIFADVLLMFWLHKKYICCLHHLKPQEISAKPGPNLVPPAPDRIRLHGEGEWSLAYGKIGSEEWTLEQHFFGEEIPSWSILMFFVFWFLDEIAHLTSGQFESFEEVLVNLTSTGLRIGQQKGLTT